MVVSETLVSIAKATILSAWVNIIKSYTCCVSGFGTWLGIVLTARIISLQGWHISEAHSKEINLETQFATFITLHSLVPDRIPENASPNIKQI